MKRILAWLLAFIICFSTVDIQTVAAANTNTNVISIRTVEDLKQLSKNCVTDQWSVGKTVILTADIDLTGSKFEPIPLFLGTFDGKGHTIRGLSLTQSGSMQGLFRHVLKGGIVRQLKVAGTVIPDGTKEAVGGIAGKNSGTIQSCSFQGTVSGNKSIGGIVGINEASGLISNCFTNGSMEGEHRIGGIAGDNYGTILQCTNKSRINTVYIKPEKSITDKDRIKKNLEDKAMADEEIIDITDIGGVAGWSSGVIQGSKNIGKIGYERIGYNVGGIVGRQSGYINKCENKGLVFGKKDVGGIVGQVEPYTAWQFNKESTESLRKELDKLNDLLKKTIDDTDSLSGTTADGLKNTIDHVDKAGDALNEMTKEAENWGNTNITNINDNIANVEDALSDTESVMENMTDFVKEMEQASGQLKDSIDQLSKAGDSVDPIWDQVEKSFESIQAGFNIIQNASLSIQSGIYHLKNALGDPKEVQKAITEISSGFSNLGQGLDNLKTAMDNLKKVSETLKENNSGSLIGELAALKKLMTSEEFYAFLKSINDGLTHFSTGLKEMNQGFKEIAKQPNFSELPSAIRDFESGTANLKNASQNFAWGMIELKKVISYLEEAGDHVQEAGNLASTAVNTMTSAIDELGTASEQLTEIVSKLTDQDFIPFATISSEFENAREQLFDSFDDISNSVTSLSDQITDKNEILKQDLEKVSDQLFNVFGTMLDKIDEVGNTSTNLSDYMDDISEEETNKRTNGVVQKCVNRGEIQAESNVGGITGAIALELSFDPEDQLKLSDFLSEGTKYVVYSVIRDCEGYSKISAKKSAVGGVVGYMDYGLVARSLGCGQVECPDGDYIGGVVGYSSGAIQNSYSRSNLTGKKYIGGIVGYGKNIKNCYAFSYIDSGEEYKGAVAGDIDHDGTIANNYYIDNTIGGVDGFSYIGQTNPIAYEKLIQVKGIPKAFQKIEVSFVVEGEEVEKIEVPFGKGIKKLPEVPNKDDEYWVWDEFDSEHIYYSMVIEGEYKQPLTTISTDEEIPQFLVEGKFYLGQELTVTPYEPDKEQLEQKMKKKKKNIQAYTISVNDYSDPLLVRMQCKENGTLYIQKENGLEKAKYKQDGSYIVFSLKNGGSFVFVEGRAKDFSSEIFSGIVFVVLVFCGFLFGKWKKKRKKLKLEEESNEQEERKE